MGLVTELQWRNRLHCLVVISHVSHPSASLEVPSVGDFLVKGQGSILLLKSVQVKGDLV